PPLEAGARVAVVIEDCLPVGLLPAAAPLADLLRVGRQIPAHRFARRGWVVPPPLAACCQCALRMLLPVPAGIFTAAIAAVASEPIGCLPFGAELIGRLALAALGAGLGAGHILLLPPVDGEPAAGLRGSPARRRDCLTVRTRGLAAPCTRR